MKRYLGVLAAIPFFAVINTVEAAPMIFNTCGATGATGPTQAACDVAYGAGVVTVAGGIQSWTVATAGTYRVIATGAAGASAQPGRTGGRGAQVATDLVFSMGDILQLAVGQMGIADVNVDNGGGGGGSFVVDMANNPLLVAGGGGGTRVGAGQNGHDASITQFGTTGSQSASTGGGALKVVDLGLGGQNGTFSWGSGGAGFFGDGANDGSFGTGGSSWANGLAGGVELSCIGGPSDGGFGGGGAGAGCGGGGGGGGYSGGDGGFIAGGGGSFLAGMNQLALAGIGTGDGLISIELLTTVPEPGTLALFGLGLLGLGIARRKRAA